MESNWRWNREIWIPGGFMGYNPPWFADPQVRFAAELITPVVIPGAGTATHIAVGPRMPGGSRYWLGKITSVDVFPPNFQWIDSNINHAAGDRFPLAAFPVHPD